ncbi:hypothetical protein [Flavivirga sp. 57AJ16]|uniref:hypothetical protein n=1 Tax=Flavivirga sp. 57AJ16 TaxID=3025307 RepID=UPI002365FBEC|nr:hypothetical protein [Flavivirga sp. 57AJ16]MDD7886898.1 hypothetical protein [Flavivirga sp. 57AJ16]
MSAVQSDLSASKYGYDMVVGTTQASINATMKQFLLKFDGQEFVKIYVYKKDVPEGESHFVETDYNAYKAILGFDPFDVPNDAPMNDERVKKLIANFFAFGFKTKMGLPTTFPLSSLPNIIELDKGSSSVSYHLFCKEFQVVDLRTGGYDGGSWNNLSQEGEDAPWVFGFTVDLDLYGNDSAFSHLPEDVQSQVKNLCPGSMFSVQQLYLDLNTAGLESTPEIKNLDPTSDVYIYLTKIFLNKYFKNMQDNSKSEINPDGNYLLGYSIKPSCTGDSSSIAPTDLNFMVSPYLDDKGNATKEYEMYTLNWLVMTEYNKMPAPVQFEWNWVDKVNKSEYHGAMAIKKGIFTNFLSTVLSPTLNSACIIPNCNVHANFISVKFKWGWKRETRPQFYQVVNDGTSKILTYNFSRKSHSSDTHIPNWGNIDYNYNLKTDVYLEGTTIRTVTTATVWLHVNGGWGIVVEGNCSKYKSTVVYTIGVNSYGNLTVKGSAPKIVDQSDRMDSSAWAKIATLGFIDKLIKTMKNTTQGWMNNFMTGHQNRIESMLNGSGIWVFPGSQTFVFKNAKFSNSQDLVSDVTYVEPSTKMIAKRSALKAAATAAATIKTPETVS